MDTDSFILHVKTDDFYKDMLEQHKEYDLSEYKPEHPIYKLM